MKRATIIFLLLTAVTPTCFSRESRSVRIDLASAIIYGRIDFGAEYAFCENWSSGAEVAVNLKRLTDGPGDEEREHWTELYGTVYTGIVHEGSSNTECGIFFHYWPNKAFDGPVMEVGFRVKDRGRPDMTAGIGYYCRIWKGIRAVFACKVGILGHIKNQTAPSDGLRIGISYAF